jgi:tRNA pseudouridine38-40 synthase
MVSKPREPRKRRLALLVEYDGTGYGGSQHQKNAPTVQGALESALRSLTGEQIRVALAGRTDAGVHALGQVAALTTASRHSPAVFVRACNARLPKDIVVRAAREVPGAWNPRREAVSRLYRYTLCVQGTRPALLRRRAWHINQTLDDKAMTEAAESLVGAHDFAAFAPHSEARGSTIRCIARVALSRAPGRLLHFDIEGNAFLHHMVRRIMAALVEVGRGRRSVEDFAALVSEAQPGAASSMAPAHGLCLMKVRYESGLFDDETNEDI